MCASLSHCHQGYLMQNAWLCGIATKGLFIFITDLGADNHYSTLEH